MHYYFVDVPYQTSLGLTVEKKRWTEVDLPVDSLEGQDEVN